MSFLGFTNNLQGVSNGKLALLAGQAAVNLWVFWRLSRWFYKLTNDQKTREDLVNNTYRMAKNYGFGNQIQAEMDKTKEMLLAGFQADYLDEVGHFTSLPLEGYDQAKILKILKDWSDRENPKWEEGQVSGAVYHGEAEHLNLLNQAYAMYSVSNPLHPDVWPSLRKMEAEVVAMTASLVNGGDDGVVGCLTSGGTESIILSCKTHRDWARDTKGITRPEIIIPKTAHAAFSKAADLLGIKVVKIPVHPETFRVDLFKMREAINANTIMLVGSAPQFPHGIIDPIEGISQLADKHGIGMHVDACLGGFILPFIQDDKLPEWNFKLPGVTAMSLDTHKFGFAPKGSSVVLYRNEKLRDYQFFTFTDWPGGLYTTSNLPGSRVGGLSAACWASLMSLGHNGYQQLTTQIITASQELKTGLMKMPEIKVLGDPQLMVCAFTMTEESGLNIYRVADDLSNLGWSLNVLQDPAALHFCLTVRQVDKIPKFLLDLSQVIEDEKAQEFDQEQQQTDGEDDKHEMAPIYGQLASLPSGPINDVLKVYQRVMWTP